MSKELELLAAVKEADIDTIKNLIKAGANVNYKDKDKESYGYTWPLMHHCIFKENGQRKKEFVTAAERR